MKKLFAIAGVMLFATFATPARAGIDFAKMTQDCSSISELAIHYEACVAAVTYAHKRLLLHKEILRTQVSGEVYANSFAAYRRALEEIKKEFPYVWENRVSTK